MTTAPAPSGLVPSKHFTRPGPVAGFFADSLLGLLQRLSPPARVRLARTVGSLVFSLGIRRKVALDNLSHALGELPEAERREIARGAYCNMLCMLLDAYAAAGPRQGGLEGTYRLKHPEAFAEAVRAGKGVILVSAHYGSWEMFGEALAPLGVRLAAVAKPLKGALNARLLQHRLDVGCTMLLPKGAVGQAIESLVDGRVVLLLIDQSLPADKGVFVPFFGREASTTPVASVVAQRSGAPVFVALIRREVEGMEVEFEGPFPVPSTGDARADAHAHTAQLTATLEKAIRKRPEQWLWLHRRWKVQRRAE